MNYDSNCKYTRPKDNDFDKWLIEFDLAYTNYCNTVEYIENAYYESRDMKDVFIRIDQRNYYHYVFHNMPQGMNQIKKIAVFCYWMLKYRPLRCKFRPKTNFEKNDEKAKSDYDNAHALFTERFCLQLLDNMSWYYLGKGIDISEPNMRELEYVLRHADVGKEALTMIFDILVDTSAYHA